jgi:YD repeat-containing protein
MTENTVTDSRGMTAYAYDSRERLVSRTDPTGTSPLLASGKTIEYAYDAAGNVTQVTTAAGTTVSGYDAQNRLATVADAGKTTQYVYDLAGNPAETQLPNGVVEKRTYWAGKVKIVGKSDRGILMSNPNLKYRIKLTAEQRQELLEVAKNGKKSAREIRHANVLLMADDNAEEGRWRDVDISAALNLHVNTIASIRKKFVLGGIPPALERKPRASPPNPPKLDVPRWKRF